MEFIIQLLFSSVLYSLCNIIKSVIMALKNPKVCPKGLHCFTDKADCKLLHLAID